MLTSRSPKKKPTIHGKGHRHRETVTLEEGLPGGLKWAYRSSRLINCRYERSFISRLPSSCRLVAVMGMQVAELVVDGLTPGG